MRPSKTINPQAVQPVMRPQTNQKPVMRPPMAINQKPNVSSEPKKEMYEEVFIGNNDL